MARQEVQFDLVVDIQQARQQLNDLENILMRTLSLARRLGDENLKQLISVVQTTIRWINQLRLALKFLHMARMAAGDPLAWATAGLAFADLAVDVGSTVVLELSGEMPQ